MDSVYDYTLLISFGSKLRLMFLRVFRSYFCPHHPAFVTAPVSAHSTCFCPQHPAFVYSTLLFNNRMESADDGMKPADEGLLAAVLACHLALLRVVPRDLRSGTTRLPRQPV